MGWMADEAFDAMLVAEEDQYYTERSALNQDVWWSAGERIQITKLTSAHLHAITTMLERDPKSMMLHDQWLERMHREQADRENALQKLFSGLT